MSQECIEQIEALNETRNKPTEDKLKFAKKERGFLNVEVEIQLKVWGVAHLIARDQLIRNQVSPSHSRSPLKTKEFSFPSGNASNFESTQEYNQKPERRLEKRNQMGIYQMVTQKKWNPYTEGNFQNLT